MMDPLPSKTSIYNRLKSIIVMSQKATCIYVLKVILWMGMILPKGPLNVELVRLSLKKNLTYLYPYSSYLTSRALALVASTFYRHPTNDLSLIGVTGTNGKTTVTYLLEKIFKE